MLASPYATHRNKRRGTKTFLRRKHRKIIPDLYYIKNIRPNNTCFIVAFDSNFCSEFLNLRNLFE